MNQVIKYFTITCNCNKLLFIITLFFLPLSIFSQVLNVDRENGQDTIKKRFIASTLLSFSSDKQKNDQIEFSNSTEIDYFLKNNYMFIFLTQTENDYNGSKVLENNGYFQLRFRDNDKRKIAPDVFSQFQWNGILGLEERALGGINARMRWLEKKRSDLYTSIGVFYEFEKWNTRLSSYSYASDSIGTIYRNILRLNTVAKFALKLGDKIDFAGTSYVQFPLNSNFLQPRWFVDMNLYFAVSKHLNFLLHYDHNYDAYRPLPIDEYYYSINFGIQLKI